MASTIAAWNHFGDWLAPMLFEFLDFQCLLDVEVAGRFAQPELGKEFQRRGMSTGAVSYHTGVRVGEGANPKCELGSWLRRRASFWKEFYPETLPENERPHVVVSGGKNGKVPTRLHTLPEAVVDTHNRSALIRQLPYDCRPIVPLTFGVQKGSSTFVEVKLSWAERRNGEACQFGVMAGTSGRPSIWFSSSAGAICRYFADGCYYGWPLSDLVVESNIGARQTIRSGIGISACGQLTFYRNTQEDSGAWEAAGPFDMAQLFEPHGGMPDHLQIGICIVDRLTPLAVDLIRVESELPVLSKQPQCNVQWRWRPSA